MSKLIILLFLLGCIFSCHRTSNEIDELTLKRMKQVRENIRLELGDAYDQPIAAATAEQLKRGTELYPLICASCHGVRGTGEGVTVKEGLFIKPADFTNPAQATFYSDRARIHIIRKGVPGTPMMGWENVLTDDDILSVYLYIQSLAQPK